jgi:hypothetical protein
MKKIFTVLLMVLSVSVFADYAYKMVGGKVGKLKVITEAQTADYRGQGFTVTADRLALYNLLVSTGQEQAAIDRGIIPTPAERILAQSKFLKLDIRRAMRDMIISQTRVAAAVYGEPDVVTTVTNESVLDALLASNPMMQKDWNDSTEINLADPLVIQALSAGNIDVSTVKLKILTLQK